MPSFHDFGLQPTTLTTLERMGITEPTPIQSAAIPALMAGHDLVGQSATGSGKTLAYSLPLVERLARNRRVAQALILVPTRELATQVNTVLGALAKSRHLTTALLVGGKPYGNQISALKYGAQIIVGTPGRVQDHLDRGSLLLNDLRICVLDEADQMLDSGFAPAVEKILITAPETRQIALFSATMPDWVAKLQEKFLKEPVKIEITAETGGQSTIEQIAYQVPQSQKMAALCALLTSTPGESTLVFGRTKYGVEKLGKQLDKLGFTVGTLHGNKSQRARDEVLTAFRRGKVQTLLATNVAARGLDIKGIFQVINYELPESSELFTHRIGRTGRMGQQGRAITLLAPADLSKWRRMARSFGEAVDLHRLTVDEETGVVVIPTRLTPSLSEVPAPARPVMDRATHAAQHQAAAPKRRRPVMSEQRGSTTAAINAQQKPQEQISGRSTKPARRPQTLPFPEHSSFEEARGDRKRAGAQSHSGNGARQSRAHSAPVPITQYRQGKRRAGTTTGRAPQAVASKRTARR